MSKLDKVFIWAIGLMLLANVVGQAIVAYQNIQIEKLEVRKGELLHEIYELNQ